MRKIKWLSVLLLVIIIIMSTVPIYAGDLQGIGDSDDKKIEELKIGDKQVRSQYCESTLIDKKVIYNDDTKQNELVNVWKAKITQTPQYLDDLETKIDTKWSYVDGQFVSGANLFNAYADGKTVHVEHDGLMLEWCPDVMADMSVIKPTSDKPTIVDDLYNENYSDNTLMWDYGICKRYIRVIEGLLQEIYIFDKSPDCNVTIYDNLKKDTGFKGKREAVAFDANGTSIDMGIMKSISKGQFNDPTMAYPITIDPDLSYTTSASDGYLDQADGDFTSYSTCRTDSTSSDISYTGTVSYVGQYKSTGGDYNIYRSFLYFDTSGFPDDLTISAASLFLYFNYEGTGADFNIIVQTGTSSTYPHDPMTTSDFNYTLYTGSGGSLSTIDLPLEEYSEIELNATGYGWINKTGNTKFCLRSEEDINNSAPTNYERVRYTTYEYGTGYQPYLEVTYATDEPSITIQEESNVATTTARLNALVSDDGGESCEVRFGYGTTTQAAVDFDDYDTITEWDAGWDTGEYPYYDATGLTADTTYYYRAQIKNSDSTVTSTGETELTTINAISDPTILSGIPYFDYNSLSWTIPSGATNVEIRYKTDTYPTSTSDGTQVYFGSLSTYSHTSLDSGKTYYYSMWGESGDSYSSNYITMALTTLGYSSASGDDIPVPIMPNQFDQTVDATGLYKLEPFYSAVAGFATSWGMQTNNMWVIIVVIISVLLSCGVLVRTKKMGMALLTLCILWGIAVGLKLLPAYFIVFVICAGIGAWATSRES